MRARVGFGVGHIVTPVYQRIGLPERAAKTN